MVMDLLDSLLEEFGKAVDIEKLAADENRTCLIKVLETTQQKKCKLHHV